MRKLLRNEKPRQSHILAGQRSLSLKLREVIKSHVAKFTSKETRTSGTGGVNNLSVQEDLQTLMVRKEALDEDDVERRRYFDQVIRLHGEVVRQMGAKN